MRPRVWSNWFQSISSASHQTRLAGIRWFTGPEGLTGYCTALAKMAWMTVADRLAGRVRVPLREATCFTTRRIERGVWLGRPGQAGPAPRTKF